MNPKIKYKINKKINEIIDDNNLVISNDEPNYDINNTYSKSTQTTDQVKQQTTPEPIYNRKGKGIYGYGMGGNSLFYPYGESIENKTKNLIETFIDKNEKEEDKEIVSKDEKNKKIKKLIKSLSDEEMIEMTSEIILKLKEKNISKVIDLISKSLKEMLSNNKKEEPKEDNKNSINEENSELMNKTFEIPLTIINTIKKNFEQNKNILKGEGLKRIKYLIEKNGKISYQEVKRLINFLEDCFDETLCRIINKEQLLPFLKKSLDSKREHIKNGKKIKSDTGMLNQFRKESSFKIDNTFNKNKF